MAYECYIILLLLAIPLKPEPIYYIMFKFNFTLAYLNSQGFGCVQVTKRFIH